MDKHSFSSYGWIVIAVIVIAVMILFATPFGARITNGVLGIAKDIMDVGGNAAAEAPDFEIPEFEPIVPVPKYVPEGYRLLSKRDVGKTFGKELSSWVYIDTNVAPNEMDPAEYAVMGSNLYIGVLIDDGSISFDGNFGSFSVWSGTVWDKNVSARMMATGIGSSIDYYQEGSWNNWLYVKDKDPSAPNIPEGYRLLDKSDSGKRFGIQLGHLYVDASATPNCSLLTYDQCGSDWFYDDTGGGLITGHTGNSIQVSAPEGFVTMYDNATNKWNAEGLSRLSELVGVGKCWVAPGLKDGWNNWLYVSDTNLSAYKLVTSSDSGREIADSSLGYFIDTSVRPKFPTGSATYTISGENFSITVTNKTIIAHTSSGDIQLFNVDQWDKWESYEEFEKLNLSGKITSCTDGDWNNWFYVKLK